MKMSELKNFDIEALEKKDTELGQELFNLRFQHATHQLENTARIKTVRRLRARVKTILTEKKIG